MSVVGVDWWANRAARFLSSSAFFHSSTDVIPKLAMIFCSNRQKFRASSLLFNHGVEFGNGFHVVVLQELVELLGTLDILDDLIIVVEMVLIAVEGWEERLCARRFFPEPPQESVERRAVVLRGSTVLGVLVDRCRDFLHHEGFVFRGETINVRDDLRREEFIAQISSEQLENVQEGGVDIACINGEFCSLLERPVLVWKDAPFGDDRKIVRLVELQGRVEVSEPRVGIFSLELGCQRFD